MRPEVVAFVSAFCAAVLAGPVLLTATAYLLWRKRARAAPRADAIIPTPAFLPAFVRECGATLFTLAAGLAGPHSNAVHPPPGPLALLLPDAGASAGIFFFVRRRLRRMGWNVAVGVTHRTPEHVSSAARELRDRLRCLAPVHPHIVLIGHGTGGLVARSLPLEPSGSAVRQVITLGTPHQGTNAPINRLPGFRGLRPGSALMRRLAAADDPPPSTERVAIYSEFDAWVVPVEAAYDPAAFNIQVRGIGHFSLLTSRRVFALLAENLATPPSQADAPAALTAASTRSTSSESL